jgi:hypothetical protein
MRSCLVTRSFWVTCSALDSKACGDVLPAAPRSAFDSTDRSGFLVMTVEDVTLRRDGAFDLALPFLGVALSRFRVLAETSWR